MRSVLPSFLALALSAILCMPAPAVPLQPQYVLISFDGAHDLNQWQRSRELAQQTGARFTYFLSCTFLLSPETAAFYRAPGKGAGRSNTGFAASRQEVAQRLGHIWASHLEGHEIANHACGHFDGKDWTRQEWREELQAFSQFLREAWTLNEIPGEPHGWRDLAQTGVVGFRAPYLSVNAAMYEALAEEGLRYDASAVSSAPATPGEKGGIVRFALPLIPEGPRARPVIAMDYNLYVRHSGATEQPEAADIYRERAYSAFMAAFEREFGGLRRPLQIGLHFTLMNGGAYWEALERFAADVCPLPQVRCTTHRQYLEETGGPVPRG